MKVLFRIIASRPTSEGCHGSYLLEYIDPSCLILDFASLRLTLGFLCLKLKIPSQIVQFIEKLPAACSRQPESSSESSRNCLASAIPALRHSAQST